MKTLEKPSGYMPPNRKINELAYKTALSTLNKHFVIQCAPNSKYHSEDLNQSLLYLTVEKAYAESGLQNLACTRRKVPSADTLFRRVKSLHWKEAHRMLVEANDHVIRKLKRRGVFRKPVDAAADLSDDPWYGKFNNKNCRGKVDRGTNQFYRHASLHVVEASKRVPIFTVMVTIFDDHASIIERLVRAARSRGIRIRNLLVDRGFNGVEVVNKLKELRQPFLMPAKKTKGVKQAIERYDKGQTSAVVDFTIEGAENKKASCRLYMRMKKDAKVTDPVMVRYIGFFTDMSVERIILAYELLPEEYRKRWGIETGFKVQDGVQAKTASPNFAVRLAYVMLSTILYNVWVWANAVLEGKLHVKFKKPKIKLSFLAYYFSRQIEHPYKPP